MKKLIHGLVLGSSLLSLEAAVLNFSNPANISLNEPNTTHSAPTVAAPYPATISVSGVTDPVSTIRVILNNINQTRMDDIDMLLVSPTGVKFVILSDAGGSVAPTGITLTLGDSAAAQVPDAGPIPAGGGTYQPTCVDNANNINTAFPAPAPAGPYLAAAPRGVATFASAFAGINVNGTWSLYAADDTVNNGQVASITGGWTIEITTAPAAVATATALNSSPNPSFTTTPNNAVTFTATVTKQSDGTPVTAGTVTFREGATTLAATVALNGSGQGSFNISTLSEGVHTITADYNGTASFLTSSSNRTQTVDNHTVVAGSTFCNTGVITFADAVAPGGANVYPSRIFVAGLPGTISKVTVQIKSLNHTRPDDIDLLLVSPSGAKFILLSDAGGTTAASGANVTFDDAAASTVPDGGPIVTGTYRPSSYTAADTFPSPAPAGPYLTPAAEGGDTLAAFNGADPNGTWTLYVVDDVVNAGFVNTIALGWCLTFTTSGDTPTFTTLTSSLNPSLVAQSITLTAAVKRVSNSNAVTTGTVTFREGGNILASAVAVNGSGVATFNTSALTEGSHVITADYSGVPGSFNVSSGVLTQRVDTATVVSSNRYSNPGVITIPAGATVPPAYPSRILVSNAGSTISNITVDIGGISIDRPDDLELLLVSPTGANIVLLSDAGGTVTPASGVSITFSDAAAGFVPDSGPLASGTFKPTSPTGAATFPAPAPGGPYNHPGPAGSATLASIFGGANPNGYWSLYVVDDVIGGGGTIANGWSISLLGPPSVACPANIVTTNALGQCQSAPVSFAATANGAPSATLSYRIGTTPITSPFAFPLGVTTVSVTASNVYGTAACSFTVTVQAASTPQLTIVRANTNAVLSWSNSFNCYTLQFTPRLFPSSATNVWSNYPGPFVTNAGRIYVTNSSSLSNRFFRLRF